MYENIFKPIKIGNVEIPNRLFMPPMATGIWDGTRLTDPSQIAYYVARAKGGIGLINTSAYTVDLDTAGLVENGQPSLTLPNAGEKLKVLVDEIHKTDAKICIQIQHPGRQTNHILNPEKDIVGPSAIPEVFYMDTPRALTNAEVKEMIQKFIRAAKIVYDAGADGVELHAAHGYLIGEFMSPRANVRTDEYGGNFENRMRFVKEIIDGIKEFKPENAFLSIRMNAFDAVEGGIELEEGIRMAKYLEAAGLEAIDLSLGTYTNAFLCSEPAIYPEGVRSEWVKQFTDTLNIPVISVNNVKRPETAEMLLKDGVSDMVGLGRALLADPEYVNKLKAGKENEINLCLGCCECLFMNDPQVCSINPYLGKEWYLNDATMKKDGEGRQVVIIGSGPAGLQAAEVAAQRGFKVDVFEAKNSLGGSLIPASKGPGKEKFAWSLSNKINVLNKFGVHFHLNTKIETAEDIEKYNPYAVFVGVGAAPACPPIPGVQNLTQALDVLMTEKDNLPENKKVIIIGSGMTGLETAELLLTKKNKIVMYDMLPEIASSANLFTKMVSTMELAKAGVEFRTEHKLLEVKGNTAIFENLKTKEKVEDTADILLLSLGVKSNTELNEKFNSVCDKVFIVGDCLKGANIHKATSAAFECAWNM